MSGYVKASAMRILRESNLHKLGVGRLMELERDVTEQTNDNEPNDDMQVAGAIGELCPFLQIDTLCLDRYWRSSSRPLAFLGSRLRNGIWRL